jgi:hypothetical protein
VALQHFFNPDSKDHRYLTNYDEGAAWKGYEWRGVLGKIFTSQVEGTTELSGEEGHIGYIFLSPEKNTRALYYCVSNYGDFFTTSSQEAANAQSQPFTDCKGVVGYVGA